MTRLFCCLGVVAAMAVLTVAVFGVSGAAATAHAKAGCPNLRHRYLVLISAQTGRVDCAFPDAGRPVAMVTDGHGGWFIADGPQVFSVGGVRVNGIAHLRPDGRLDRSWRCRIPRMESQGGVFHLIRVGGTLYASSSGWVGSYSVRSGARRWLVVNRKGGWGNGLAADRSRVFVGGWSGARFAGVRHLAPVALDARTGKVLRWRLALPRQFLEQVGQLALDRGSLFLTASGSQPVNQEFVAVYARNGRFTGWRAPPIAIGVSVITHGLVLGIDQPILSESTGQPVPAFSHVYGAVFAAAGETLYVAGNCDQGSSFTRPDDIGAVNLVTGTPTNWAPTGFARDSANGFACFQAMAADRQQVLVAVD